MASASMSPWTRTPINFAKTYRFTSPPKILTRQYRSTPSAQYGILMQPLVSKFAMLEAGLCLKTRGFQVKCFGWGMDKVRSSIPPASS